MAVQLPFLFRYGVLQSLRCCHERSIRQVCTIRRKAVGFLNYLEVDPEVSQRLWLIFGFSQVYICRWSTPQKSLGRLSKRGA